MQLGDLIEIEGHRWFVFKRINTTDTAILVDAENQREAVGMELDETEPERCKVVCNPIQDWHHLVLDANRSWKGIQGITWFQLRGEDRNLRMLEDWVKADQTQMGGPLFFNPKLGLLHGDVLSATLADGKVGRISIPKGFGTVAQRRARKTEVLPKDRTAYDHLLDGEFDD